MIKEGGQISILEVLLEFVCLGYDLFKNKNRIFKKSNDNNAKSPVNPNLDSYQTDDVVRGLPFDFLLDWEIIFEHSLQDVLIHTGETANRITAANGARAVTIGNEIYFSDGEYAPDTEAGKVLLAHELAHVVQAQDGKPMRYHEDIEKLEHEAERFEYGIDGIGIHSIRGFEWTGERTSKASGDVGHIDLEEFGQRNQKNIIICVDRQGNEYWMTQKQYREGIEYVRSELKKHYGELLTDEDRYKFLKKMRKY